MKNSLFLFFCLLPLVLVAQPKVIENPDYRFKRTGLETITRIELHDTITKVHVHVTFLPHWWIEYDALSYIQPVGSSERYHLTGLENAEMGKHLTTPSGIADYVLLFPPLDRSVKEIHYGNLKDYKEVIEIFDISLEKSFDFARYEKSRKIPKSVAKRLKDEVRKTSGRKTTDFDSDTFFDTSPARLVGFVRGYKGDSLQTHWMNFRRLNGEVNGFALTLYPDGYFEADIKVEHPKMFSFQLLDNGQTNFYIEPGHTLSMILDWEDVLEGDRYRDRRYIYTKTVFDGTLADINQDLLKRTISKPNASDIDRQMKNMTPAEHRQDLETRIKNNLEALRKTDAEHILSPKAKRLIENEIKADALSELLQFSVSYMRREKENKEPYLSADYYSLLEMLPDNDRSLLSVLSAERMISLLPTAGIFFRPGNFYQPGFKPEQSFTDYLLRKGVKLSEETKRMLPLIQRMAETKVTEVSEELKKEVKEHSEEIQAVLQSHINEWMEYQRKYTKSDPSEDYGINTQKREEILTDSLHINGLLKDVCMFRYFYEWLHRNTNIPADEFKSFTENSRNRLENPFLRKLFTEISILSQGAPYTDFTEKSLSGELCTLSTVVPQKKLVLLDFWASWCRPCIQEMPLLSELYAQYKDKGLEIVGISLDEQEPAWKKAVETNEMSWIQLICNNKNPENVAKRYKVRSIPFTVLIDNTGTIVAINLRGEQLKEKIKKILD